MLTSSTADATIDFKVTVVNRNFVVSTNTPPFFEPPLPTLTLNAGSSKYFILPDTVDKEGDSVKIKVFQNAMPVFVDYYQRNFTISPKSTDSGEFAI